MLRKQQEVISRTGWTAGAPLAAVLCLFSASALQHGCGVLRSNNRVIYEITPPAEAALAEGDTVELGYQAVHKSAAGGLSKKVFSGSTRFELESLSPRMTDFWVNVRRKGDGGIYLAGRAEKGIQLDGESTFIVRIALKPSTAPAGAGGDAK